VLWCRQYPDPDARKGFSAAGAAWHLRLPVLRALFEQVNTTPGALGPLRLHEVLEWAAGTLRRVDDAAFFKRFQEDHAVQYFYEPFLEAFDPELRQQLGVWYTPPEVVDYMVERGDRTLRDELGIANGLADDRVVVLDPCCGTGSYLVAVLRRIERTLREQGEEALVGQFVKRVATGRVVGFEIMAAPFVVAHVQIALLLESLGAPRAEEGTHTSERAEWPRIRLTNAPTGWDPETDKPGYLPLPDFHNERELARQVKREAPVLVVLGNPPYSGYAGMSDSAEERGLTEFYRKVRNVRPPEGQGLNDLYLRFYRMAERRIAEQAGRGVVCFISNYSWLDGLSHSGMRERYLERAIMTDGARYHAEQVRDRLRKRGFLEDNMVRYCYRPLDDRWLYWEPETKLLDEKRPNYWPQRVSGQPLAQRRQPQPQGPLLPAPGDREPRRPPHRRVQRRHVSALPED